MKKYRLVKDIYNCGRKPNFHYVIEKKTIFGWSRFYLWTFWNPYYEFKYLDEANKFLACLNGESPFKTKEIL